MQWDLIARPGVLLNLARDAVTPPSMPRYPECSSSSSSSISNGSSNLRSISSSISSGSCCGSSSSSSSSSNSSSSSKARSKNKSRNDNVLVRLDEEIGPHAKAVLAALYRKGRPGSYVFAPLTLPQYETALKRVAASVPHLNGRSAASHAIRAKILTLRKPGLRGHWASLRSVRTYEKSSRLYIIIKNLKRKATRGNSIATTTVTATNPFVRLVARLKTTVTSLRRSS